MRRREVIAGLAAMAWPSATQAQQTAVPRIGVHLRRHPWRPEVRDSKLMHAVLELELHGWKRRVSSSAKPRARRASLADRVGLARGGRRCDGGRGPVLRPGLDFPRPGPAQGCDLVEYDLAVPERDAEFLQVRRVEVRQGSKVDVVRGEDLGVFAEPDTVQPLLDGCCHARLRFWLPLRHMIASDPAVGARSSPAASGVGGKTVIRAEDLENFRQGLRGRLITPCDARLR